MFPTRDAARRALVLVLLVLPAPGCHALDTRGRALVPTRYQTRTGPYRLWTHAPIPPEDPTLANLAGLETQIEGELGVKVDPGEEPVDIYILDDRKAFEQFLTFYHPDLPPRRAFFLAQGERRVVYAYQGDNLEVDLRHEATHALLHASGADLPLWLDEGLAEYFEVPRADGGYNAEHLARLPKDIDGGWRPDLARLETLQEVRRMTPRDYRESWAWVHYLLHGPSAGRAALIGTIADIRRDEPGAPLSDRLRAADAKGKGGDPTARLVAHVEAMAKAGPPERAPTVVRVASRAPLVVRGQSTTLGPTSVVEPATGPASAASRPRGGPVTRLFRWMGRSIAGR
jgi:hypothetical protein